VLQNPVAEDPKQFPQLIAMLKKRINAKLSTA